MTGQESSVQLTMEPLHTPGKANSAKGRAGNPPTTPLQLAEASLNIAGYRNPAQSGAGKRGKRWKFSKDHLHLSGTIKGQGL